jgi:hypothetical protein
MRSGDDNVYQNLSLAFGRIFIDSVERDHSRKSRNPIPSRRGWRLLADDVSCSGTNGNIPRSKLFNTALITQAEIDSRYPTHIRDEAPTSDS